MSTGAKIGIGALVIVGVLAFCLITAVLNWGGRWLGKVSEVTGPENVEQQYDSMYDLHESLEQIDSNVQLMQNKIENYEENSGSRKNWTEGQRERYSSMQDKLGSYVTQYNRVAKEYNSKAKNIFEGEKVGPKELPHSVDTYDLSKLQ